MYSRGSFAHQLNKELDNIRNQRNKLGKYLYYVTELIYCLKTLNFHGNICQEVCILHIADRQSLSSPSALIS